MRRVLCEIDEDYRLAQPYIEPSIVYIQSLSPSELEIHMERTRGYIRVYEHALHKLRDIAPTLTPEEIIDAYPKVCHLLQRSLSWYMFSSFDSIYSEIMRQVVMDQDPTIAPIFLMTLAEHNDSDIGDLVKHSLSSNDKMIIERAIEVATRLRLVDSIPFLIDIVNRCEGAIVNLALSAINSLQQENQ